MGSYKISAEKLLSLKSELEDCLAKRPGIVERVSDARELGDLKENAEYHGARDEQRSNESRIEEIEAILENYEIIDSVDTDQVSLGSRVLLVGTDGQKREYRIMGSLEADPANGILSEESPIGLQLIGKKVGESIEIAGNSYKIEEVGA